VAGAIVLAVGLVATCAAVSLGWLVPFYLVAAATGSGFGNVTLHVDVPETFQLFAAPLVVLVAGMAFLAGRPRAPG
jgi:hypothetical protein